MQHIQVFTDGSVNTQLKIGYAAYLIVYEKNASIESLKNKIKIKRFEDTSSTKLELQTLLWSLDEVIYKHNESEMLVTVYTDSQNIIRLPARRAALEKNHYLTSKNIRLKHAELYQEFYRLTSLMNCKLVKMTGHQPSDTKSHVDKLFALVDKASRRALREEF